MLHLRPRTARDETVKIALDEKPTFYFSPALVPRLEEDRLQDAHLGLWYVDIDARRPSGWTRTGSGALGAAPDVVARFQWLAYAKRLQNYMGADLSLLAWRRQEHSGHRRDERRPPPRVRHRREVPLLHGQHRFGPVLQPDIHSLARPVTRALPGGAVQGRALAVGPESDEEKGRGEEAGRGQAREQKPAKTRSRRPNGRAREGARGQAQDPSTVKIDLDGILQRILAVPMPARHYVDLQAGKAGTLLALEAPRRSRHGWRARDDRPSLRSQGAQGRRRRLAAWASSRSPRNGEKYLYSQGGRWAIGALRPMPPAGAPRRRPRRRRPGPIPCRRPAIQVRI